MPVPIIMTPGRYLRLRREAKGLTLDDLALCLETTPPVCARSRVDWLAQMEADTVEISLNSAITLATLIGFDIRILSRLIAARDGTLEVPIAPMCRICACSEWDPCQTWDPAVEVMRPCSWIELDLCSAHAQAEAEAVAA